MISWIKKRLGLGKNREQDIHAAFGEGIREMRLHRSRLDSQDAAFQAALNSGDMSRAWDVLGSQIKANSQEICRRSSRKGEGA